MNENEEDCEVQDNTECADEEDEGNDEYTKHGPHDSPVTKRKGL